MLHPIRKLARDIQRQSVWLVVPLYLVCGWAALAGVGQTTLVLGLPDWTPRLALVLFLLLLPLVAATAVVQDGLPGLRIVDEVDPNELEGLTPADVLVVPEHHPLHRRTLLTWRNTVLAALTSVALLIATVTAYLTMWALGIGPVGSLVAQGVIQVRDSVALVAFRNRTDDPTLSAIVSDAFALDLADSRVVTVVPGSGSLTESSQPISAFRLIVEGDVERRGRGFHLVATVLQAGSGSQLARFEQQAETEDDLLPSLERLSERVREKLGESIADIRALPPPRGVVTSVEAMRLYGRGAQAARAGDAASAVSLLEEAVGLDEGFAMAWRRLGILHEEQADTLRARDAYRHALAVWDDATGTPRRTAIELRERLSGLGG